MMTSIRELIEGLAELAAILPDHEETEVRFGICNGTDVQFIENADIDRWSHVTRNGEAIKHFVLLRGHIHPGQEAGEVLRGAAADVDQELRNLTDEDGG